MKSPPSESPGGLKWSLPHRARDQEQQREKEQETIESRFYVFWGSTLNMEVY